MAALLNIDQDVFNSLVKYSEELQQRVQIRADTILYGLALQLRKMLSRLIDKCLRILVEELLLRIGPVGISDDDAVHHLVHVVLEAHIIFICTCDIFDQQVVVLIISEELEHRKTEEEDERNDADPDIEHQLRPYPAEGLLFLYSAQDSFAILLYSLGDTPCVFLKI